MINWYKQIDTIKSESFLPQIIIVAGETVDSKSNYYWDNSIRKDTPHIVFQYTLQGKGILEINGKQSEVAPEQGFVLKIPSANTKYFYPSDCDEKWMFVYCCFSGGTCEYLYEQTTAKYGNLFNLPTATPIIRDLFSFRHRAAKAINAAEGADFVFKLLTTLSTSKYSLQSNPYNLIINKAKRYIQENTDKPINVSDIANSIDISREYLTRLFVEYLSTTPHKYIERGKLLEALGLLLNTELSNKQIAYKCGFSSAAQFGRTFKRVIGTTPQKYRKQKSIYKTTLLSF